MNSLIYIFRFLYHFRFWLILLPLAVAGILIVGTMGMSGTYDVSSTIYTGVVSGFNIESDDDSKQDWNSINNTMDNLTNIISSQTALRRTSMRLFAQHMMYGDPNKDNNYIQARNFKKLLLHTPPEVQRLIDKSSEQNTLANLYAYEQESPTNYVYGLFHWVHPHYSYEALSKISVKRLGNSDMIELRFNCSDPGIAYNTLKILNEEFIKQYEELRFGETNNVISYFEAELLRLSQLLRNAEDSLTTYSVEKKIINFPEQTKYVAALGHDFALMYEQILLNYTGSKRLVEHLEEQIDEQVKALRNNGEFIAQLNTISGMSSKIAMIESFQSDSVRVDTKQLSTLRKEQQKAEQAASNLASLISEQKYTKEGVSSESVVSQWLTELIRFEKSKAELKVMDDRKLELDSQYAYFSPVGSTLKRKEREIGFTEQSYLTVLQGLNAAKLRQKNLQMTSATLKILNPPVFPISAMPSQRKLIVGIGFVGTLLFLLGLFLTLELLDRTLRDKIRAERLSGAKVIGASPYEPKFAYRAYYAMWTERATTYLSHSLTRYLVHKTTPNIINVLSNDIGDGKNFVAEHLHDYWRSQGMKIKLLKAGEDFAIDNRKYILAQGLNDLYTFSDEDIIIVVYPSLSDTSIPAILLQEASVNLLTIRANRVWKDTDQMLYDKLADASKDVPLFMYLTKADKIVVENFTGLLPPFTYLRRLGYRMYQFGLTSKDK